MRISDNSFLIEEAYNQEAGVVQHINTFARSKGGDWAYGLTQEWPFRGQRHQLSYSVPLERIQASEGSSTRLGDIALNYRLQVVTLPDGLAFSPRLSLLLPTGDEKTGHGSGGLGLQLNMPLSVPLSSRLVTHYNAGVTLVPRAHDAAGERAGTTGFNLGASAILLVSPTFNIMLETVWLSEEAVLGADLTGRSESAFLNPGIRYAINTRGGLQIVPGLAYTIGVGPSEGERGVFIYLSFEHAFRRIADSE
ncbi:MAG: transporter [Gemmatimonadota bacterium]